MSRFALFLVALSAFAVSAFADGDVEFLIDKRNYSLTNAVIGAAEKIKIPDGVRIVDVGVFEYCEQLREVVFPNSLDMILTGAFNGCTSLESLKLPDDLTFINTCAFQDCKALKSVKLPEYLKCIKLGTFRGCKSLKEIVIPASVTNIEAGAFAQCSSLSRVLMRKNVERTIARGAFEVWTEIIEISGSTNRLPWVAVTFDANGGAVAEAFVRLVKDHNYGILPTPVRDGYWFAGWWTEKEGGSKIEITTKVPGEGTIYAHWKIAAPGEFETGGDAEWSLQSDGSWMSGYMFGGDSTWLKTVFEGAGTISFDWMLSRPQPWYELKFSVDGEAVEYLGGETKWVHVSCKVENADLHTFAWEYSKSAEVGYDVDFGSVKDIVWTRRKSEAEQLAEISECLGADVTFENIPQIANAELTRLDDGASWRLSVEFLDGGVPRDVTGNKVAALFEATTDLSDWTGSAAHAVSVIPATPGSSASHTFTIVPAQPVPARLFLRINCGTFD